MQKFINAIRLTLTAAMILGVFFEAGPVTALFAVLVTIALEIMSYKSNELDRNLAATMRAIDLKLRCG